MGQSQSQTDNDLKNTTEIIFEQKVILLTIVPFYVINKEEFEYNLSTGNDQLDESVNEKIKKCEPYLEKLLSNNCQYNTLAAVTKDNRIYLTVEKTNKEIFDSDDCDFIRKFFDRYNQNDQKLVIINKNEAETSPFFEDLGDLQLGFAVDQIDYI